MTVMKSSPDADRSTWHPEWHYIQELFDTTIAFNRLLGLETLSMSATQVQVGFAMKPELQGNPVHGILHGGVVSTVLDSVGGMMALICIVAEKRTDPAHQSERDWNKIMRSLGTIDLRVDFLRPGKGQYFTAQASILRKGNKIAVTRMELHNEKQDLLALGTGTYLVG